MNMQPLRSPAAAQQRSCASRDEEGSDVAAPAALSSWITAEIGACVDRVTDRCRAELEAARRERDEARQQAQHECARAAAVEAEAANLRAAFGASLDEWQLEQARALGDHARTCASLPLDQLLSIFHELGKGNTAANVLAALVDGLAREFTRVALFRVDGGGLECTRQTGFDAQSDISRRAIPLLGNSLLTRCVKTRHPEAYFSAPHADSGATVLFGGTPACALAMPIVFQGEVVGVVYADDSNDAECPEGTPQARAKFGELVYRHAMQMLVGLSTAHASHQPCSHVEGTFQPTVDEVPQALRDLALRLADELEQEYTANAEIGRNRLVCQQRLREQLEQARRFYAERILQSEGALEGPMAANFLDQHLIAIARARRDTSFGCDLTTLVAS
jgi:hypothetical protein